MSEQTLKSGPTSMGGAKSAQDLSSVFVDKGAPIPETYGETKIALLPRDPHWMYTYWEVTDQTIQEIKRLYGEDIFYSSQSTLRMVQISDDLKPVKTIDVTIALDAKNWYLNAEEEGSSWYVELGLKAADGRFILIAKSNLITLPMARVSNSIDEKWVSIKDELERVLEASGGGKVGMGSLELARILTQRWLTLNQQISSWKGSSGMSSFGVGALELLGIKERGFRLVADCDLILYGATESTATVTVAGRPVELSPDGTFSLQFSLPDGTLDLPVKAISGDRVEERSIHISVERKSQYQP